MNTIQLELEELIKYFRATHKIFEKEMGLPNLSWEEGYATGQHNAYGDAIERCEGLMEVVTSVHPESESRNIPE